MFNFDDLSDAAGLWEAQYSLFLAWLSDGNAAPGVKGILAKLESSDDDELASACCILSRLLVDTMGNFELQGDDEGDETLELPAEDERRQLNHLTAFLRPKINRETLTEALLDELLSFRVQRKMLGSIVRVFSDRRNQYVTYLVLETLETIVDTLTLYKPLLEVMGDTLAALDLEGLTQSRLAQVYTARRLVNKPLDREDDFDYEDDSKDEGVGS